MRAYYNEIDPLKAEIIREAIQAGAIAPGDVDERSIVDVEPADLMGYAQCHFFAGGGFWSVALRQAGWSDDREVWTGSTPCPSFSAAGKGQGFDDPRHLWPAWARLIRECRPSTIFGEQVSAAIGHGWLDLVQTDLEAQDYAVGKIVLGAASVGAPHIRQRLYFVAQSGCVPERRRVCGPGESGVAARTGAPGQLVGSSANYALANTADARRQAAGQHGSGQPLFPARPEQRGESLVVVDAEGRGLGMCGSASGQAGYTAQPSESGDLGNSDRKGLPEQRWGKFTSGSGQSRIGESCELADADGGNASAERQQRSGEQRQQPQDSGAGIVGISESERRQSGPARNEVDGEGMESAKRESIKSASGSEDAGSVAEPLHAERWPFNVDGQNGCDGEDAGRQEAHDDFGTCGEVCRSSALNGFWRDADWIGCRDGKFRPVPGTTKSSPLSVVNGDFADLGYFLLPSGRGFAFSPLIEKGKERVGRLRLYGDAICVPAARAFIEAYLEAESAKNDVDVMRGR
jgi:DNA (cytosine-5)-methyltransferase 1